MKLGLVTIQRDRGPWLIEWFAFHYLVGFRKFYFYAHLCTDDTAKIISQLAGIFDITAFVLDKQQNAIQLAAYQHAISNYMDEVDWMCFLDGDEFIFPTAHSTLPEALTEYADANISALGVYNCNFGSSGHITEPDGLVTENYKMCAHADFLAHRRVKSIVKGRQNINVSTNSHLFMTPNGTVDESMRPITHGYMPDYIPSYAKFRINHYVCQSRQYFLSFKKNSGHADAGSSAVREDEWWTNFDTNVRADHAISRFAQPLRKLVGEIRAKLGLPPLPVIA